jgi:ATP-dependent DNA helicase DinG
MQNGELSISSAAGTIARALSSFTGSHAEIVKTGAAAVLDSAFDVYYELYSFLWETAEILTGFTDHKSNLVHYADCSNKVATLKSAPLSVAPLLKGYYDCKSSKPKYSAIAYLSATLAVNKNFTNFAYRSGLSLLSPDVHQTNYPTAFDYDKQAVFYVGSHLPAPEQASLPQYRKAVTTEIASLVNACKGNAFVLFTSREDLEYVTANIVGQLDSSIEVVSQLDYSAQAALKQFKTMPNSALFGMKSFWEGVDIPGDKLQLVIITKLPFPNSKDPIISARSDAAGDRAFIDVIIPEMISDLRQGVGRLIRSKTDRGVIALLDSRALNKSYKNTILNSLGVTKVLTDSARVLRNLEFLASQRT